MRPSDTPPPLPSIFDLGRQLAALEIARRHQNAACLESRDDGKKRQASAAMPAQTLAGAAVQIACATHIPTNLHADQYDEGEI